MDEHIADGPLFIDAGLPLCRIGREGKAHELEWDAGEILDERGMFGIESHIAEPDRGIGSRNMRLLIFGRRFLPGQREREEEKTREHERDGKPGMFFEVVHRFKSKVYKVLPAMLHIAMQAGESHIL